MEFSKEVFYDLVYESCIAYNNFKVYIELTIVFLIATLAKYWIQIKPLNENFKSHFILHK